ncbi:hypothetical protein Hanom_Chr08g00694161 [Helianthus anomalus]
MNIQRIICIYIYIYELYIERGIPHLLDQGQGVMELLQQWRLQQQLKQRVCETSELVWTCCKKRKFEES